MTEATQATKKRPIDAVTKHFRGKLAEGLEVYHVEAWNLDVYYRKINTLKQESRIVELSTQGKSVEALVETIIIKALDSEGNALFTNHDKTVLMNEADPAVILELSRALNRSDLPQVEDIEKNS